MPYNENGDWYPSRRSSYRCSVCNVHFASDAIAPVNSYGDRVCTQCRSNYYAKKYKK